MKLYLFDTDTGIYLGQDFGSDSDLNFREGMTIVPPPEYDQGQTPVYDFEHQHWVLIDTAKLPSVLLQKKSASKNEP